MTHSSSTPDEFDQAIADTAQELEEIAQQTLDDEKVKKALDDENRDDAW